MLKPSTSPVPAFGMYEARRSVPNSEAATRWLKEPGQKRRLMVGNRAPVTTCPPREGVQCVMIQWSDEIGDWFASPLVVLLPFEDMFPAAVELFASDFTRAVANRKRVM